MLTALIAGVAAAGMGAVAGPSPTTPSARSTLCGSGAERDRVEVRVFPVGISRRVFPRPKEIMEKGGHGFLVRGVWEQMMAGICDGNLPDTDTGTYEFLPRVVVFVEGEEDREPLLLEYPDAGDSPPPVRGRVNGRMVTVPAALVRRLLDITREGWRD